MQEPRTLCEMFQQALEQRPRADAYLHKVDGAYRPVSSQEMAARVRAVACGLLQLGVRPGERVAILSENRLEWAIADYAILHCGAVTVPIYATLQPAAVQKMLADSGAVAIFVADGAQLSKLGTRADLPELRHAVLVAGDPPAAPAPWPVHRWRDLEAHGAAADPDAFVRAWQAVRAEDLATLIYTSGTSGTPKGVPLTHANILANIYALLRCVPMTPRDTVLSFMPLSHLLERNCGHFLMWHAGASIAYAESVETVSQNLIEVRPTVLIAAPRLYEKMNARMRAAVEQAPPLRRWLFVWSQATGRERVHREQAGQPLPLGLRLRCRIADRLVFARLRQRLGGRMRVSVSGGAPMSRSIAEFFYAAGIEILEGYGLTECSPVLCVNPVERSRIGTVGPPLDNVELRIAANGEILARGPSVLREYWHNPAATTETIRDGWFHTGDVGEIDGDGYVRITDRLKDLIVTAGGKKVAPQPIESRLKTFQHLAEAVLIGDQRQYLSALVVPNFHNLERWAQTHGVAFASRAELVQAPAVLRQFEKYIGHVNRDLAPFERIKRFRLLDRELQSKAGELTPSMKVRRSVITTTFADLIESLYAEHPGAGIGCPPTESEPAPAARRHARHASAV